MSHTDGLYIGLMSGTSLDGIDAALVQSSHGRLHLIASLNQPYSDSLRQTLNHLCHDDSPRLSQIMEMDVQLAELMAGAVNTLLQQTNMLAGDIVAIGSHGQTIRHLPDHGHATTLQIADPNRIAELTGITTIADFRRRDMAAGGQGAPLVPAFHQAVFQSPVQDRVAVNIGGISNVTILPAGSSAQGIAGFDTGPGNCLMDYWVHLHRGEGYDAHGQWAASGNVIPDLLQPLQDDPYFRRPPPKSSGREYFNPNWLAPHLHGHNYATADVQATLCRLTAWCISEAIRCHAGRTSELIVCGGGAHNRTLLAMLQEELGEGIEIVSSQVHGIHPDWVEAMAFAWLAYRHEAGLPGNLPEVTGAREAVILGGRYPA